MKTKLIYAIAVLLLVSGFISCKKNTDTPIISSSFTIVNTISGAGALVVNFDNTSPLQYYKVAIVTPIPAYSSASPFMEFPSHIGSFPLGVSLTTDTLHTIYKGTVKLEAGSIRSLFLTGTLTDVDTVFTNDKVPAFAPADSLVGIRFVNASKGSPALTVNIKNQTTNLVSDLAYKGASNYFSFSAKKTNPATVNYIFEIHDPAAANKLITSYTLTTALMLTRLGKSYTIALRGLPSGTGVNAQAAVLVNNY
jgi:hypothetical protein